MTDQDLLSLGGLFIASVGLALTGQRYVSGIADKLRSEWRADDIRVEADITALEVRLNTMRETLATKEDLARVEAQLARVNDGISHQGAIEERVAGMQRSLSRIENFLMGASPGRLAPSSGAD